MARPRRTGPICPWCGSPADRECDGPIAVPEGADRRDPSQTTCSAPVCSRCSTHVQAARPITAIVCSRGRGGRGCERIDNRGDLCPFCVRRQGADLLPREEHDRELAQAIADAHESNVIRGRFGDRGHKSANRRQDPKATTKYPTGDKIDENANFGRGPRHGDRLYLIDGGIVHRCYHAIPVEHAPATGQPINALVGFLRTLRKLRQRLNPRPQWVLTAFDAAPDGGWRAQMHPGYKAGREPQPADLTAQWGPICELLDAMGLSYVRVPGVEADDLLASYCEAAVMHRLEVVIVTTDKDLAQLIRGDGGPGSVRCLSPFGDLELRGPEWVVERFGVRPDQLADYLALAGDRVDGIPGAPGIGPTTAARMLSEHESLAGVLDRWQLIRPRKVSDAIGKNREKILLSRELVGLRCDAPPVSEIQGIRPWAPKRASLDAYFARLGFPRFEAALDRYELHEYTHPRCRGGA